MLRFVLPLTALTLGLILVRAFREERAPPGATVTTTTIAMIAAAVSDPIGTRNWTATMPTLISAIASSSSGMTAIDAESSRTAPLSKRCPR